jgi:transcriptional regulator with XRE-family HTH domain
MQALSLTTDLQPYTPLVKTGRPAKRERTPFGQRLHTLREQAGLSQQQLADRLGLTQRAYAHWERNPVALRPDQLLNLAQALNVSVEDLVGSNGSKKRGTGPTGKMRQLFEAASRLPRNQQQKIAAILEPFIEHHAAR